jgi:hypothetical protein
MFIFKLFQSLMLKSRHNIPLSEQLINPIGKSYIGNLDTPSTLTNRRRILNISSRIHMRKSTFPRISKNSLKIPKG